MPLDPQTTDSAVSILGTGAMGAALAATLVAAGQRVTVWNRTPERAQPLVRQGALPAASALDAICASPVSLLVLLDYAAVDEILSDDVLAAVRGRTLVVMTFGSRAEVSEAAAKVQRADGAFLGAGILAYPRAIGRAGSTIFYGGDAAAYGMHERLLAHLSGTQRFVSTDPVAAQTVLTASAAIGFAASVAYFEVAAWAETTGLSPGVLAEHARAAVLPWLDDCLADAGRRIPVAAFDGDQATVDVHASGLDAALADMQQARVGTGTLEAVQVYVQAAQRMGLGACDFSALFRVIRGDVSLSP